jgi:hypothetical protein
MVLSKQEVGVALMDFDKFGDIVQTAVSLGEVCCKGIDVPGNYRSDSVHFLCYADCSYSRPG